jgi:hypothetical protein
MQLNTTTFTLAEYCQQMEDKLIIVNHDYQRSQKIWPAVARSYLIDTILGGYPIPKLILSQTTDLQSRKTIKEIVDGQQRSQAILDFFKDNLRLSGQTTFAGMTYSQLDDETQTRFLSYAIGVDLLVGVTPREIREIFRRMNSYTIPLNHQERRHAIYQGAFKWFIARLTEQWAEPLKAMGVLTERAISRMDDAELFTEVLFAYENGIQSRSQKKLDNFYQQHEKDASLDQYESYLKEAMNDLLRWEGIHNGPLLASYSFYSLVLALIHLRHPSSQLLSVFDPSGLSIRDDAVVLNNFGTLVNALEAPSSNDNLKSFVTAYSKSTTKKIPRETRMRFLCRALTEDQIE